MKATLAFVACLLTAGFLTAAEVTGNNIAVVIRKDVVKSDNGYQFLCVPVNGLTIDGTVKETIPLNTLIPPSTIVAGTSMIIGDVTYTVNNNDQWVNQNSEVVNPEIPCGTAFWLQDPAQKTKNGAALLSGSVSLMSTGNADPTIFCGQQRTRTAPNWADLTAGKVTAVVNDSSEAITLAEAVTIAGETPRTNDQIMTLRNGSSDYKSYYYRNGAWVGKVSGNNVNQPITGAVIMPGEAFYYYKATK